MAAPRTFDNFMAKVELWLEKHYGCNTADLPDYDYYRAYEAGATPSACGKAAWRWAQTF